MQISYIPNNTIAGLFHAFHALGKASVFFVALAILSNSSLSQTRFTDTIHVDEINIQGLRSFEKIGLHQLDIDSFKLNLNVEKSLGDIFSFYLPVSVRNYGPGGISTLSYRGAGASHTQVLWNGININSTMLGQTDFAQLPVFLIDEIELYHGGKSSGNQSGAAGGGIYLHSKPDWNNRFKLTFGQSFGSFNQYQSRVSLALKNKNHIFDFRCFYGQSSFVATRNNEELITGNKNGFSTSGFLHNYFYQSPTGVNVLQLSAWVQEKTNRAHFLTGQKTELQNDRIARAVAEWKNYKGPRMLVIRSAVSFNQLNYKQSISGDVLIDSRNQMGSFFENLDLNYSLSNTIKWISGLSFNHHLAKTTNYESRTVRNESGIYSGFHVENPWFAGFFTIKSLLSNPYFLPFIPAAGIDLTPFSFKSLHFKANASSNFHLPSLNDLYWIDDGYSSGNENLKPEKGKSAEGGISWNATHQKIHLNAEITCFWSEIDDWISWQPNSKGKWQPINYDCVRRTGNEISLQFETSVRKFTVEGSGNFSYVKAISINAKAMSDSNEGSQLIYVPKHLGNASLKLGYNTYWLALNASLTGKRFTSTDNYYSLPPYGVFNVFIGKEFVVKSHTFRFQLAVNNLSDRGYESIQAYPMPGRNYMINVSYRLNEK
jgi:outer membrane cobalamin receptor